MLGEVFHHGEWQTHGFGNVVAHASDAPMPLRCYRCELTVDDHGKEEMGVNFVEHGVQQNWQAKGGGVGREPEQPD